MRTDFYKRTIYLGEHATRFPAVGEIVWTTERADDARYPVPEIGEPGIIEVQCGGFETGPDSQYYRAVVHEHGALRTQVGGNSWYVSWRLTEQVQRVRDGLYVPITGGAKEDG